MWRRSSPHPASPLARVVTPADRRVARPVPWRVYAGLVLAQVLWASLYPASKPLLQMVTPAQVALVRGVTAWLLLTALALLVSGPQAFRAALRRPLGPLILGWLSFFGSSTIMLLALHDLPAAVNGVLNNTSPLWLALGALLLGRARPLTVLGTLLALLGVAVILLGDSLLFLLATPLALSPRGVALALLGSGVIALSHVWGRRVMVGSDPLVMTGLSAGFAVPPLLVVAELTGGLAALGAVPLPAALLLLYVGVGCTAVNFALWFWALKHLSPTRAAPFQYLIPPLGVVLAWLALGEPPTPGLLLGTALVLGGIALTQRPEPALR